LRGFEGNKTMQSNVTEQTYIKIAEQREGWEEFFNQYRHFEVFGTLSFPQDNITEADINLKFKKWCTSASVASNLRLAALGIAPLHIRPHCHFLLYGKGHNYETISDRLSLKALDSEEQRKRLTKFFGGCWFGESDFQFIPSNEASKRIIKYISNGKNLTAGGFMPLIYGKSLLKKRMVK
jgi:hypothetical protein